MAAISNDWLEVLKTEFGKPYYKKLYNTIVSEYNSYEIFPSKENLFKAYELTPLSKVKAVIIGQDPYHGIGQAMGLSFSVPKGVDVPPSLQNIYKEIYDDLGIISPDCGDLTSWADQGVLLLNTVLTVRAHLPGSHRGIGWEEFTDATIIALNKLDRPIVFMLWGAPACSKERMLDNPKHLVLKAPHPSPLSAYRGFFGCKHFSKANEFLIKNDITPINWRIYD